MELRLVRALRSRRRPQDVALVAGCCAVEVLRIYAPTPPYNAAELKVRRPAK